MTEGKVATLTDRTNDDKIVEKTGKEKRSANGAAGATTRERNETGSVEKTEAGADLRAKKAMRAKGFTMPLTEGLSKGMGSHRNEPGDDLVCMFPGISLGRRSKQEMSFVRFERTANGLVFTGEGRELDWDFKTVSNDAKKVAKTGDVLIGVVGNLSYVDRLGRVVMAIDDFVNEFSIADERPLNVERHVANVFETLKRKGVFDKYHGFTIDVMIGSKRRQGRHLFAVDAYRFTFDKITPYKNLDANASSLAMGLVSLYPETVMREIDHNAPLKEIIRRNEKITRLVIECATIYEKAGLFVGDSPVGGTVRSVWLK